MIVMPRSHRSRRLALRPPRAADAPAVFAFAGDSEVTRYLEWPTHAHVDDSREFIDDVKAGWHAGDDYTWLIEHGRPPRVIGSVACQFDEHGAQFGYALVRVCWGAGLATEALCVVFEAAQAIDEVQRFWATCDPDNPASMRVLEKAGMRREAVLARWSMRPNLDAHRARDAVVFAWTR